MDDLKKEPEDTSGTLVTCRFWDHNKARLVGVPLAVPTTLGPASVAIRHTCEQLCRKKGYPMWVQPSGIAGDDVWLAFRFVGAQAHLVRPFPSKDAAEMWVIHNGDR